MTKPIKTLLVAGALALATTPALADPPEHANGPKSDPTTEQPAQPGPGASNKAKAKAYGKYCKGQSKKHVKGEKGTPFSRCVTAMAKLGSGKTENPKKACKGLSKKHVKGQKGTPFSQCVRAAKKLKADQEEAETETETEGTAPTDGSTPEAPQN